jgi:hypothetical protein
LFAVLSLGIPIGLFLLLFTWQNLEVIRLGRETTKLQKDLKSVDAEHKALQAELDRLTSFDAVQDKVTTLGFAPTDAKTIVLVEGAGSRALVQGAGSRAQGAGAPPPTVAGVAP